LPSLASLLPILALQSTPQQLTSTELSIGGAAALARQTFAGAEVGIAHRPGADSRIAFALAAGTMTPVQRAAVRAQLSLQLLLNSSARTGIGMYASVGAAVTARRGTPGQGFVALLLGVEAAPGRRHGWFIESGFAGGVRLAAGWRARWFPSWWRGA
jgi:hypothetical protein